MPIDCKAESGKCEGRSDDVTNTLLKFFLEFTLYKRRLVLGYEENVEEI